MCDKSRVVLWLLAAGSALLLAAALLLPTVVVVLFAPPVGPIIGVGSMWTASTVLTVVVVVLGLPLICTPCFTSQRKRWWLPLPITALALLALVYMVLVNFAETGGFGFTLFGIVAVALLSLCTLAEALVARRRGRPVPPAF
jgi:hypothetical protein